MQMHSHISLGHRYNLTGGHIGASCELILIFYSVLRICTTWHMHVRLHERVGFAENLTRFLFKYEYCAIIEDASWSPVHWYGQC